MSQHLIALTGNVPLLRQRALREVVGKFRQAGYRIDRVNGESAGEVETSLSSAGGLFFEGATALVVENPDKVPVEVLEKHYAAGDDDTLLVLDYDGVPKGNTKFAKFLKTLGKSHYEFVAPDKPWELESYCINFCVKEARLNGKSIEEALARQMVLKLGTDIGFLSFEIRKASLLAEVENCSVLTADIVNRSMAPVAQVLVSPVMDALSSRSRKALLIALDRVRRTHKDNPTMFMCRMVGANVLKWISIVDLAQKGHSADSIAEMINVNAWHLKKNLAPQVSRWRWADLCRLVQALAESERGVLNGHVDPWIGFVARLVEVCG